MAADTLRYFTFGLVLTILSASSPLASAIRLAPAPEPELEPGLDVEGAIDPEPEWPPRSASAHGRGRFQHHVPNLTQFRVDWESFKKNDSLEVLEESRGYTVVVGIFSTMRLEDAAYRSVIRDTWMRQPLVCSLADWRENRTHKTQNCRIVVTFVVGHTAKGWVKSGLAEPDEIEEDVMVLPIKENMNCGKTRAWFKFAAKEYSWATHIAKMDMDAYLHAKVLLKRMHMSTIKYPDCPNVFGGVTHTCGFDDPNPGCPLRGCRFNPRRNSTLAYEFLEKDPNCWHYMQGGLYYMSTKFAGEVATRSMVWQELEEQCLPEDAVTGHAINRYARALNICVTAVNLRKLWNGTEPEVVKHGLP